MTSSRSAGRPLASAPAVAAGLWLFSAAGGLVIVISAVIGIDPAARDAWTAVIMFALIAIDALTCTTVGALIVMRRPDNVVGWLLAAIGVGLALTFAGFGLAGTRTAQIGRADRPRNDPDVSIWVWGSSGLLARFESRAGGRLVRHLPGHPLKPGPRGRR